tara:strand:- start:6538 stop:6882 length:345 start_codon:yes stop_codon:yes gene_type:complete
MAQSRTQYAAMKVEILTDPIARGYAGMTDEQVLADLRAETRSRNRTSMSGREVAAGVINAAYNALTDAQKSQFLALVVSDDIDPFGMGANVIKDLFGAGSTTVTNLAAARVELG